MKALTTFPSFRTSRRPLVAFLIFACVIFAAYETAEIILSGDFSTLAYIAIFCIGVAVVIAILNDWHRGVYLLFAWILFEDLFRKYLGNNMAIYFGKDVLALVLF